MGSGIGVDDGAESLFVAVHVFAYGSGKPLHVSRGEDDARYQDRHVVDLEHEVQDELTRCMTDERSVCEASKSDILVYEERGLRWLRGGGSCLGGMRAGLC